ncbi:oligosaccharide flippase family protein [Sellimonas caecigallum]|uniref:Polysaccharide biosynthesis protein n=1 Tax=Sellimonas caecigallum TaxID=2592333 RepID=A0ABS7L956_9FIRM|nr:oligosaccharide flippase family protein [Sellimonas caecigallum]MBY0759335.1 polysaccharide biosynthesis protein [Sellimonas caecigallum]
MKVNQLRAGVVMTYLNIGLGSLIPIIYTPIMLRILGQAEYGLYSLANSVVGYLSLLTFGLGSTIVRYVAKYRAEGDKDGEEKAIGLFIVMYCFLAILVLIGGAVISCNVEPIFHRGLSKAEIEKIAVLVQIMAFNTAISFPISVFGSIIMAHEQYIYRQAVNILSTVAVPCVNIVVLYMGLGSIGLSIVSTALQFLMLPLNAGYCFKVLKIKPQFKHLPITLIKELVRFSFFVFVGSIVDMLFWATDKVILGMFTSTAVVAVYNIGVTFNTMMTSISTAFSGVLTPKITVMVTKHAQPEQLTELFIRIGRLQYLIIALALSGFIVFGREFILLWAGPRYEQAYYIAIITLIPLSIPLIQNTGLSIVIAQNKHQFRSIVYLIIAIVNVMSTYCVVPYLGGVGAALCSAISYIIGQGVIMNIYYYKVTMINIPLFWKNIILLTIIPFIMTIAGLCVFYYFKLNSWLILFSAIIIYSLLYILLMFKFSMNSYEKDIIWKPLSKIIFKGRK